MAVILFPNTLINATKDEVTLVTNEKKGNHNVNNNVKQKEPNEDDEDEY